MKLQHFISYCLVSLALTTTACNSDDSQSGTDAAAQTPAIAEESITYDGDNVSMNGFIAYDSNNKEKRPAVLIIHEWWGLNDYVKDRARQLAQLGYVAMAMDMYGNGQTADNPDSADKLSGYFYEHPDAANARFGAALNKLKSYSQVDGSKVAAIGYCFGGAMVLGAAKMGQDLAGVVSFHGGGLNAVPANKDLLKAKILVCHGGDDPFVPQAEVDQFKKSMDSIQANYTLKVYPGATHAFTNPAATEKGKQFNIPIAYNAAADSASWKDMKDFFGTIFK